MTQDNTVNWDRPKLERFKKEYEKAVKENVATFKFDGKEFVPGFAKYLIEYLETRIQK
jgi:hypothetical protein